MASVLQYQSHPLEVQQNGFVWREKTGFRQFFLLGDNNSIYLHFDLLNFAELSQPALFLTT